MDKNILIVPWENEFGEYKQLFSMKCFRCSSFLGSYPASKYMFKVNSRNTEARCEICQKLTIKTPESRSVVFIVNFEHGSHLVLVCFFFVILDHVIADWVIAPALTRQIIFKMYYLLKRALKISHSPSNLP